MLEKKISIMQPYFFPYLGYYRLLAESNIFVIFDCVQFPRRGWVHRNKFTVPNGQEKWLTLPIKKGPQSMRICELEFQQYANNLLDKRIKSFPYLSSLLHINKDFSDLLAINEDINNVSSYLSKQIKQVAEIFNFNVEIIQSSHLNIPNNLRSTERIFYIMELLGCSTYINCPGGVDIYSKNNFCKKGFNIKFLTHYKGSKISTLERILSENLTDLLDDISNSISYIENI